MLLDSQVSIAWAFAGPSKIATRLKIVEPSADWLQRIDPCLVAQLDENVLIDLCCQKPAIHRYPKVMAQRIHALANDVCQYYAGDAESIWTTASDARETFERLKSLPGFGEEKAQITVAALCKRLNIELSGWEAIAHPFSDAHPRTVADCGSLEDFEAVKSWKAKQKAAKLGKADRSGS